jgi:hypothetical protein
MILPAPPTPKIFVSMEKWSLNHAQWNGHRCEMGTSNHASGRHGLGGEPKVTRDFPNSLIFLNIGFFSSVVLILQKVITVN